MYVKIEEYQQRVLLFFFSILTHTETLMDVLLLLRTANKNAFLNVIKISILKFYQFSK